MRPVRPLFLFAVASLIPLASLVSSSAGAALPAEFQTQLDQTLARLATYDIGVDTGPATAVADLVMATSGKPEQRQALAAGLAALLSSGAPYGAKDVACRHLSLIGTAASVPALAAIVTDEKLSYMARYALERIADPVADEALRKALDKTTGKVRIGVINSLGNRRDIQAIVLLAKLVGDADVATGVAAAGALGKIGPAAAMTLAEALGSASPKVRPAVASAAVLCAEQLLQKGDRDAAAALYAKARTVETPKATRLAATHGLIRARQAAGVPIFVELLQAPDAQYFALALFVARELPGPEATQALAAALPTLSAARQALLLEALADRADKAVQPVVLKLGQSAEPVTRAAAIAALARLGDASTVPWLVMQARGEGEVAQAAQNALAALPGKGVNEAILALAGQGDAKARQTVVEILGRRRAAAAVGRLFQAAGDADVAVRLAAIKALGDTAAKQDLAGLARLIVSAKDERETAAVEAAIGALCLRTSDKDACAAVLLSTLPQGNPEARCAMLRALGQVSGARALAAIKAAVRDPDETVRDAAVRVLAGWLDDAAAGDLAALATTAADKKHKILALRGYIRLIGLPGLDAGKRLAMCTQALALADRDDERKLVLGAASAIQSPAALSLIVAQLGTPSLKNDAAAAAVSLGARLARTQAQAVHEAMQKVIAVADNKTVARRATDLLESTGKK